MKYKLEITRVNNGYIAKNSKDTFVFEKLDSLAKTMAEEIEKTPVGKTFVLEFDLLDKKED